MAAESLHGFEDGLVAWLLTYALHSTVLIALAWAAAVVLARIACGSQRLRDSLPSIRERLWKLALVGGLATASAQMTFGIDPWGLQLALRSSLAPQPAVYAPIVVQAAPVQAPIADAVHRTGAAPAALLTDAARTVPSEPVAQDSWSAGGWVGVVLAMWGAGVLFGLARWACQWNRLLRNLDDREPILSGHVYEIFQHLRLRGGSRAAVRLSAAPGLQAPITLGLRRCEICLPPRVATELQHDEIAALLAHELAHAERHDPLWVVACRAIEVVFFFQPFNRVCAGWLADEAEYLCDDRAVVRIGERVALASCLTEIAGWIVHSTPTRLAPGMAAPGTRLSLRVGRLLDEDHDPAAAPASRWFTAALVPAALSVAILVPGVAAEAPRADSDSDFASDSDMEADPKLIERARELELAWQSQSTGTQDEILDDTQTVDASAQPDEAARADQPAPEAAQLGESLPPVTAPQADPATRSDATAGTEAAPLPGANAPLPQSSPSLFPPAGMNLTAPAANLFTALAPADEFAALETEIAAMRVELDKRLGGKALMQKLVSLEKRAKATHKKATDLQARLARLEQAAAFAPVVLQPSDTDRFLVTSPFTTKD